MDSAKCHSQVVQALCRCRTAKTRGQPGLSWASQRIHWMAEKHRKMLWHWIGTSRNFLGIQAVFGDMIWYDETIYWPLVVDGEAWWQGMNISNPNEDFTSKQQWYNLWMMDLIFFPAGCMRIRNKFNIRSAVKQWAGLGWIFGVLPGQPVSRKWIYRGQELYPWIRRIHKLGYGFMFLMSKSREVHRCYVR